MFFASFPLLFWNEFRYVFVENAIAYADTHMVQVGCNADPELVGLVGQLVYMSCPVTAVPSLKGSLDSSGLQSLLAGETSGTDLLWKAEIYQWKEHVNGNVTTYEQEWLLHTIDSNQFLYRQGHENVGALPSNLARKRHVVAAEGTVLVGEGYYLSESLRQQVTREAPGPVFGDQRARQQYMIGSENLGAAEVYVAEQGHRLQTFDPRYPPRIGDVRVSFELVRPAFVTILSQLVEQPLAGTELFGMPKYYFHAMPEWAQQCTPKDCLDWPPDAVRPTGRLTFRPFEVPVGHFSMGAYSVDFLYDEALTKTEMLGKLRGGNSAMVWALRFIGYAMMANGLWWAVSPIVSILQCVPLIGDWLEGFADNLAFILAALVCLPVSLAVIALAWLLARPLVGAGLLALAACTFASLVQLGLLRRKPRVSAEPFLA